MTVPSRTSNALADFIPSSAMSNPVAVLAQREGHAGAYAASKSTQPVPITQNAVQPAGTAIAHANGVHTRRLMRKATTAAIERCDDRGAKH